MLTILGKAQGKFCDGMSRRSFLTIGAAGIGGLTLPQILAAEAKAGIGKSHKAVINIFLPGGPPHQDMWDIKSDAPKEIRGEFKPIKTNVPGIEIGELFPKLAGMMDKLVPIRTMVGASGGHDAYQCMTGRKKGSPGSPPGGWASQGSWISRLKGPVHPGVPAFLSLCYDTGHKEWGDPGASGFLGFGHSPFRCIGGKSENMVLKGITLERLQDRQSLLRSVDNFRREADARGLMEGMDTFTQQAVGILTASKLADALDISKEDPKIAARYGKGDPKHRADGAPKMVESFCIARRLVEAGARAVTLNFSRWDWHGGNFKRSRQDMPMLDNAVSALVGDLHDRGMERDVSVVVWGEFGRTPKINKNAGRDHWPKVSCALLAGGGMRTGQVIGATNRLGEEAVDRPVTFAEVHATLYHNMGLLKGQERVFDLRGRPQYPINPSAQPMRELI
ncbi:MAG: DUF1501 domain-containing protein [Planctomycetes bacterium]|nr:DUF1501 domain-containing protein [Planctomycetota bacterium]